MSKENADSIEKAFRAWNRRDRAGWLAPTHPDVVWSSAIERQLGGAHRIYRGRDELGRFWDEWHSLWDMDIDLYELRDLSDAVLAFAVVRTRGKGSGAELERRIGYLFEFEDGLVKRGTSYLSPEEALQAAGLSE